MRTTSYALVQQKDKAGRHAHKRNDFLEYEQLGDLHDCNSYRIVEIPHTDYAKIELHPNIEFQDQAQSAPLKAIVKVSEPGYIPRGVKIRARISSQLFTADLLASDLDRLENDPRVVSLSVSRRLRSL